MRNVRWTAMIALWCLMVSAAPALAGELLLQNLLAVNVAADPVVDVDSFHTLETSSGELDLTDLASDVDLDAVAFHPPSKGRSAARDSDRPKRDGKDRANRGDGKDKPSDAKSHERHRLHKKMRSTFVQLHEAHENGNKEEAERLKKTLHKMYKEMRASHPAGHHHWHHGSGKRGPGKGESKSGHARKFNSEKAQRVRAQFAELRKGIEAAKEAGDDEKAAELKQKARQLAKRVFAHHRAHASAHPHACAACASAKCKKCTAKCGTKCTAKSSGCGTKCAAKCCKKSSKCGAKCAAKSVKCGTKCTAKSSGCGAKCAAKCCKKSVKCGKGAKGQCRVGKKGYKKSDRVARSGKAGGSKTPKQRLQHLRIAAANLEAAGFGDHAKKVRAEGKKIAKRIRLAAAPRGNEQVMRALLHQVRHLSREVRALRSRVDELSAKDK